MKKLLARMHIIVGAVIVGPKFYGLAWEKWGFGVMIYQEEKNGRA